MRIPRNPTGSMAGVATAIIALGLMASWSWSRSRGITIMAPAATISPAAVSGSGRMESASARRTAPRWQPVRTDSDWLSSLRHDVAPRREARPLPPVADRVFRDPSLAETPDLPVIAPPPQTAPPSVAVPAPPEVAEPSVGSFSSGLARHTIEQAPDIAACWPLPGIVMANLEELRARQVATDWVEHAAACLRELHQLESLADPRAAKTLDQLDALVAAANQIAAEQQALNDRAQLLRTAFSLERRLAIWRGVHELARPVLTPVSLSGSNFDSAVMTQRIRAVEQHIAQLDNADAWRQYLLLDHIHELESQQWSACAEQRSRLARAILTRLSAANETADQKQFFSTPTWQDFNDELRKWVVEPVDYEQLLDDLERLEETGSEDAARSVAEYYQLMRWSSSRPVAELGGRINTHYRNANVRVAISADLVNRLLPHPQTVDENIDDMLMGGRVFGRSRVSTRLSLVLFPDRQQWKMGLEAQGNVDSRTETKRGPAMFHNAGRARYLARKLLLMDHRGLRTEDAEAAAISNADLTRLETDLDGVPVVNLLVRAIARQQYDNKAGAAKSEAEDLLADRAQTRLDEEVDKQLGQATDKFHRQVLEPLESLGLRPETVDLATTQERLIARYRLAGYHQVGAFTPRPQATSDSLLSVQIHESALNNIVSSLQLNGHETDLPSLFREIAHRFRRTNYQVPEDVPTDVTLKLADRDPISLSCADNRIHVTLRIARLEGGDHNVWRDFEVRASYAPDVQGLHVRLVRDGYVRLKGRRLSMGDQVALRGIFSKVLAQHPQVDLLGNVLIRDNRLHDLRVTQFVVRDGWIGLSIGPGDPVKTRVANVPAAPQCR